MRIANLRLSIDEPESALPSHLARVLGIAPASTGALADLRKSLDARVKDALHFVYTAEVATRADEDRLIARPGASIAICRSISTRKPRFRCRRRARMPLKHRPVVVGSGPAGLVAAYFLAEQGYRPLVLERGRAVRERIQRRARASTPAAPFDPESNYLFGEGGAGTFSDGKLTCRSRAARTCAACWNCSPSARGSRRSSTIIARTWAAIACRRWSRRSAGASKRWAAKCASTAGSRISICAGRAGVRGAGRTSSGYIAGRRGAAGHRPQCPRHHRDAACGAACRWCTSRFRWACASSSRRRSSTASSTARRHWKTKLGAADYNLVATGPHDLFTFCMCAGGHIIPSVSEAGYFCTNGMSLSKRDSPFANSGLVVTVPVEHFRGSDVLAGVRLQQLLRTDGRSSWAAANTAVRSSGPSDFLADRPTTSLPACSYPRGLVLADIAELVPPIIVEAAAARLADHRSPLARQVSAGGDAGRPGIARQFAGAHRAR